MIIDEGLRSHRSRRHRTVVGADTVDPDPVGGVGVDGEVIGFGVHPGRGHPIFGEDTEAHAQAQAPEES